MTGGEFPADPAAGPTGDARPSSSSGAGDIVIRVATAADLQAIRTISNQAIRDTSALFTNEPETPAAWQERWRSRREQDPWVVAERDGAVVGFALASPFLGRCGLDATVETSVYVRPECQGLGVATALYGRLMKHLEAGGVRNVVAVIATPNPASERLHASLGFRPVGALTRVGWKFGRWHDVALWQLVLRDDDAGPRSTDETDRTGCDLSRDSRPPDACGGGSTVNNP
jgi:phosphinothricin acetyltransferase